MSNLEGYVKINPEYKRLMKEFYSCFDVRPLLNGGMTAENLVNKIWERVNLEEVLSPSSIEQKSKDPFNDWVKDETHYLLNDKVCFYTGGLPCCDGRFIHGYQWNEDKTSFKTTKPEFKGVNFNKIYTSATEEVLKAIVKRSVDVFEDWTRWNGDTKSETKLIIQYPLTRSETFSELIRGKIHPHDYFKALETFVLGQDPTNLRGSLNRYLADFYLIEDGKLIGHNQTFWMNIR